MGGSEHYGGGNMENIEASGAEFCGVSGAQLGSQIERAPPQGVNYNQSTLLDVVIEIRKDAPCSFGIDELAMHGQLNRVHDFTATESSEWERPPDALPPFAELQRPVVMHIHASERAGVNVDSFSARHDPPRRGPDALPWIGVWACGGEDARSRRQAGLLL